MKTRIVYPQMWLDEKFASCSIESKLLFCYLINNLSQGLTPYLHVNNRLITFDTGLSNEQLLKAKKELEAIKWCFFYEDWVFQNHKAAYIDYQGRDRVMIAKDTEIRSIPSKVRNHFKGLQTGYEPVLKPKSETINPKLQTINPKTGLDQMRKKLKGKLKI